MPHTPGPWKVIRGFNVATNGGQIVASCGGYSDGSRDPDKLRQEQIANAKLVAACPELLERCESILRMYATEYTVTATELIALRDLVAKAKG